MDKGGNARILLTKMFFLVLTLFLASCYNSEKKAEPVATTTEEVVTTTEPLMEERNITIIQDKGVNSEEKAILGFEEAVPSWGIPDWCFEKTDYVGIETAISNQVAKEGKASLELMVNFPDPSKGKTWTAAYIEVMHPFNWSSYKKISVDIFLPKDAPYGLGARFILTVGENWTWTEMIRTTKLVSGDWSTITANISSGSSDWRTTEINDQFRADVRKIGIRIESNRPAYNGPIYIDNIRLE